MSGILCSLCQVERPDIKRRKPSLLFCYENIAYRTVVIITANMKENLSLEKNDVPSFTSLKPFAYLPSFTLSFQGLQLPSKVRNMTITQYDVPNMIFYSLVNCSPFSVLSVVLGTFTYSIL